MIGVLWSVLQTLPEKRFLSMNPLHISSIHQALRLERHRTDVERLKFGDDDGQIHVPTVQGIPGLNKLIGSKQIDSSPEDGEEQILR